MRIASCLLLLLLAAGCSQPGPSSHPAASDSLFVNLTADRMIVQEESDIMRCDSAAARRRLDSLYRKYGKSAAEVAATTAHLQEKPEVWKDFYERVVHRIEILQQQESARPRQTGLPHENDPHRR